ncbi:hypothetical protein PCYB_132620 [Plasmodium cynomolgi strain B]|uniref:Rad4 beta-hairpin domain-containing protein n=1 Tax=Plasmodium cynomolgi (strain B) TaxID=1120755 RepID=K6UM87_PLACD|nr:hypothetical protein PCYB_132620 [Plasmodium cynomolgi strain B]GAB68388.1 hypothetical protein PCYB_132620 [Plasmodium cynomolgi strain B]
MEKRGRAAKRSPQTELNEIDLELFGEEELEILQRGHGSNDEDLQREENLEDSELLAVNQEDFIILEGASSNESATSGASNEGNSDSDVQLVQEEAAPKEGTPQRKDGASQRQDETSKRKDGTSQRKGNAKQKAHSDEDKTNRKKKKTLEDEEEQENQLSSENVSNFIQMRNKNIKKKIEENKLITHMLCWVSHLQFLNDTCNNKLAQALIYSVYVNYQKGKDSKLYKDPIYLFMFIKSTFELIIDGKSWVSGDQHVMRNHRGSILFRLLRCLNIPSRICLTLPSLRTEVDAGQDKWLLKKCRGEYHSDFSRSIFYRQFVNSVSEGSNDEDNVASCADGSAQGSRDVGSAQGSRDGGGAQGNRDVGSAQDSRDDDVILIDREEFLQSGMNSYTSSSKQGDKANSGKGSRKVVKDETAQFNIFSECYSSSFNKWVSFFFCFNVYYFNFVNFSKYDSSVAHEDKAFHILLPLPKNPEEIKTFRTQRRASALGGFARSLFMRRGGRSSKRGNEVGSEVNSQNGSEIDSEGEHGRVRGCERGCERGSERGSDTSSLRDGERKAAPGTPEASRGESCTLSRSRSNPQCSAHTGWGRLPIDGLHTGEKQKEGCPGTLERKSLPLGGPIPGGKSIPSVKDNLASSKFQILSEDHGGKMYIERDNKFFIVDKKSKRVIRIAYLETPSQGSCPPESTHQKRVHPESTHPESTHPESTHPESTHPERVHPESTHPQRAYREGKKSPVGGNRTKAGREPPLYDFELEEENSEIVDSLANIYSSGGKRNLLLNQIRELRVANSKLRGDASGASMGGEVRDYGEITYDKMANPVKASSLEGKYIKVFINSNVYKFLYNLDHYNLYMCINRYGIVRDVSVRHKLRYSGGGSGQRGGQGSIQGSCHRGGQRNRGNSSNAIIKGDSHCNAVRNHFRRIAYQINKQKYNDFEKALDKLDDEYLYNLYVTNMIPTEKTDFIKSSYYILRSMLKKNQVIYPNAPVGLFKGENVYLKENFYNLVRREYLENKHYYISDVEKPLSYEWDEYSKVKVPLYAQFQLRRRTEAAVSRRGETDLESSTNIASSGNNNGSSNGDRNGDRNGGPNGGRSGGRAEEACPLGEEENFDYIYSRKDKLHVLKTKLFAHLKASNIIELNAEDVCICNVKLKYVIKHLRGVIPYKIVYNNSYFFNKFRKRPNVPTDADKIIIKKKHMPQFKNLYIPQKQIQDEFLLSDKTKQIKNLWKVLFKSILYEQVNKKAIQDRARARAIYRMKEFNTDVDRYFQI